jgi:hypothetical protein
MPEAAWITTVDEQEASGDVAAAYEQAADRSTGRVAHILKVHSLNPRSLLAHRTRALPAGNDRGGGVSTQRLPLLNGPPRRGSPSVNQR